MEAAPRSKLGVGRELRLDLDHGRRLAGHRVNIDVQHARRSRRDSKQELSGTCNMGLI